MKNKDERIDSDPCGRAFTGYLQHRERSGNKIRRRVKSRYPIHEEIPRPEHRKSKCQACADATIKALDEFDLKMGLVPGAEVSPFAGNGPHSHAIELKRFEIMLNSKCQEYADRIDQWKKERHENYKNWREECRKIDARK
mgnify:CR=1 FL=1